MKSLSSSGLSLMFSLITRRVNTVYSVFTYFPYFFCISCLIVPSSQIWQSQVNIIINQINVIVVYHISEAERVSYIIFIKYLPGSFRMCRPASNRIYIICDSERTLLKNPIGRWERNCIHFSEIQMVFVLVNFFKPFLFIIFVLNFLKYPCRLYCLVESHSLYAFGNWNRCIYRW